MLTISAIPAKISKTKPSNACLKLVQMIKLKILHLYANIA